MDKYIISEAFDQLNRMNKKDTTKKVIKESASQVKTNRRTLNESKADNLLDLLQENFQVNWKEHADAPVPSSYPEMINVYSFNHDEYEPLRDKWSEAFVKDKNTLYIDWECQEEWYDLSGMKKEIRRWAKYWQLQAAQRQIIQTEPIKINVNVWDRSGYENEKFSITLKPLQ